MWWDALLLTPQCVVRARPRTAQRWAVRRRDARNPCSWVQPDCARRDRYFGRLHPDGVTV